MTRPEDFDQETEKALRFTYRAFYVLIALFVGAVAYALFWAIGGPS